MILEVHCQQCGWRGRRSARLHPSCCCPRCYAPGSRIVETKNLEEARKAWRVVTPQDREAQRQENERVLKGLVEQINKSLALIGKGRRA
jgi:hypothetical protein